MPPDPIFERLASLAGPDGVIPGGGWFAHRPDGTKDAYADWVDPEDAEPSS
jgi:hypothetical protein